VNKENHILTALELRCDLAELLFTVYRLLIHLKNDHSGGKPKVITEGVGFHVRYLYAFTLRYAHAFGHFGIVIDGKTALDIGASTGGFTDVLLSRGAGRVYAVDVGHGQLAWRLRQDPRVIVHERLNARHLTRAHVPEPVDVITCDASFIGLATVLPAPLALAAEEAELVALVKPQFEAGREHVGKGGVVRDPTIHHEVCERAAAWVAAQPGWMVVGVVESPVLGPEGNREFLLYARRKGADEEERQ